MKNKILSIISVIAFLMGISACHSPEEFNPTVERNIINNLTASFPDDDSDDNSFTSEVVNSMYFSGAWSTPEAFHTVKAGPAFGVRFVNRILPSLSDVV